MDTDQETFDSPATDPTFKTLLSHRSVRRYTDQPVTEADVRRMVQAAQRASTSSSQNAWSVIVVRDPARKRELQQLTGSNGFINYAPVFLVWVADLSRNRAVADELGKASDAMRFQEALLVATVDAALAAQNAAIAAEADGLGICYVGGVRSNIAATAELLDLPPLAYPVFGMTVGHPSPTDKATTRPRMPLDSVMFSETYDRQASIAGAEKLEESNRAYFESQGVPGVSWKEKTAQRWKDAAALDGRADNAAVLADLGWEAL